MVAISQIILGVLVGTSLMTLFSYLMTYEVKEQFREPQLLNELLNRSGFNIKNAWLSGWLLHYGMGAIFVIVYHFIWQFTAINPSLLSGSIFGFVNGFIGIAGWWTVFYIHKNPPSVDFNDYYIHLIVAHIIFGIGAAVGYGIASDNMAIY